MRQLPFSRLAVTLHNQNPGWYRCGFYGKDPETYENYKRNCPDFAVQTAHGFEAIGASLISQAESDDDKHENKSIIQPNK